MVAATDETRAALRDAHTRLATARSAAAAASAAADGGFEKYYRLANFLLEQDRAEQALTYAKMAKELMPEGKANYARAVDGLIKKIEDKS